MIYPLMEIWVCLSIAASLGVVAGWLVWGRGTRRTVATYRIRLARLQRNWEEVEERLTEALERAAALERERDHRYVDLGLREPGLHSSERDERRSLEESLRDLNERLLALDPASRPPLSRG